MTPRKDGEFFKPIETFLKLNTMEQNKTFQPGSKAIITEDQDGFPVGEIVTLIELSSDIDPTEWRVAVGDKCYFQQESCMELINP
jgi:hypothetical protein